MQTICKQYCEVTCICTDALAIFHFLISIELFYVVSSLIGSIPKLSQQLLENSTQEFGMWYLLFFNFCCFCGSTSAYLPLILFEKIIPSSYISCPTYIGGSHCQSYFINFSIISLLYNTTVCTERRDICICSELTSILIVLVRYGKQEGHPLIGSI